MDSEVKKVPLVPTWEGILPLLVEVAVNGNNPKVRQEAMEELRRMARAVDEMNAKAAEEAHHG